MTKIDGGDRRLSAARLSVPHLSARISPEESASVLARLIASSAAVTKVALTAQTGLARSTVAVGLGALSRINLIRSGGVIVHPGRGRPGQEIQINPLFGTIVAIDMHQLGATVSFFDFGQQELSRTLLPIHLSDGGDFCVAALVDYILTQSASVGSGPLRAAAIAVPAPVDIARGTLASPPFLSGWADFPLQEVLQGRLGCPVILRNDSDIRALGEARHLPATESPLLFINIDEGVGSGFTDAQADLFTGVSGAAGELGHLQTHVEAGVECMCGELDHLNVHASRSAMQRHWIFANSDSEDGPPQEFEDALRARRPAATRIASEAGHILGVALADALLLLNPARITVGGSVTSAGDTILAAVRSTVYERGFPLATRDLTIASSVLGDDAGLYGCLVLALEHVLAAPQLEPLLD